MLEGVGYDLRHLGRKNERIEWVAFARLMKNVAAELTDDEIRGLGAQFLRSPLLRGMMVAARLLFDTAELYRWLSTAGSGGGNQMFTCIKGRHVDLGPGHAQVELILDPGKPLAREFFLVAQGSFVVMPQIVAAPNATVVMEMLASGARFDIHYPIKRGVFGSFRRAITWPFTVRSAGRELRDANEGLAERYRELEDYRDNLEVKVAERTAELTAAQAELVTAHADLQRAQASRDRLFANVNHDLRTPLTLVRLAARDLARTLDDGAPARRALAIIDANGARLLRLVNGLLLLAASQEGRLELRPEAADVGQLVHGLVRDWEVTARTRGITLRCDAPANLAAIVDEAALDRVLVNLLSNASKVTPDGGTISVGLRVQGADLVLEVTDSGPGFEPELKTRLFQRFTQGRAGLASAQRGTGLGLNLVAELIAGHGGTIEVLDAPGGGALVRARIPWRRPADTGALADVSHAEVRTDPADLEVHVRESPAARATILIAEDNPGLRRAIEDMLAPSYRVLSAPDGLRALELAEAHAVDALVTDLGMPGLDGYGLVERFRALPQHQLVPVIVLSAQAAVDQRLRAFASGALDFVAKPFEPEELLARLDSQLLLRSLALRLGDAERLASIGRLATGFAHEVRNPVNGLANALPLLRRRLTEAGATVSAPQERLLGALETCTDRLVVLAEQLVGREASVAGDEPFREVAELALARCREARGEHAALEAGPHADVAVTCRSEELAGALASVLDNAFLAAGDGGHVRFSSRVAAGTLEIDIHDDGPGVPPDLRPRLFEPFFTTRPVGTGTGLGLYTARRVVEQTGGQIELVTASAGTHFRIRLPVRAEATS